MALHIAVVGPPGSGKTTACSILHVKYNVCHLRPTDLAQRAVEHQSSEHSFAVQRLFDQGKPVSDELLVSLISEAAQRTECANGYFIDGYPRTERQAQLMRNAKINPDAIVELVVPDRSIVERYAGRWVHKPSGRTYHTLFCPPTTAGRDNLTNEPLIQRRLDEEASVRERLQQYHTRITRLHAMYAEDNVWWPVDASGNAEAIRVGISRVADAIIADKLKSDLPWWKRSSFFSMFYRNEK